MLQVANTSAVALMSRMRQGAVGALCMIECCILRMILPFSALGFWSETLESVNSTHANALRERVLAL